MIHHSRMHVALITAVLTSLTCAVLEAQVDQSDVAARLMSSDVQVRNQAFTESLALLPDSVGSELSSAYFELLRQVNGTVEDAAQAGVALESVEDPNFVAALSRRVAELQDPAAIGVLSRAYYGGRQTSEALAEFGASAVPDVVAVVDSPQSNYDLVNFGLETLGAIVENQGGLSQLPPDLREAIRASTAGRLRGPEYFTTIWAAIDLAAVLNDPTLIGIVRRLASDAAALEARGISDPEIVARTQERAARRLSGG